MANESQEEEHKTPTATPTLFPLFNHPPSNPETLPNWLRNTSFTTHLSVLNDAVPSLTDHHAGLEPESETEEVPGGGGSVKLVYQLVDSSGSDYGDSHGRKKEQKRKQRKKHKPNDYEYAPS